MVKELYAHSVNSQGQRHELEDHLKRIAERVASMVCSRAILGCWSACIVGLWRMSPSRGSLLSAVKERKRLIQDCDSLNWVGIVKVYYEWIFCA